MSSSSRAVTLAALLAVLPVSAPSLAQAAAPSAAYHLAGEAGHGLLRPAHWSGDDGGARHHLQSPPHRWMPRHGNPHQVLRLLPPREIVQRLRHQHVRPIGRIVLRHGVYWVPALDRHGRRVLLVVDPVTAIVLGRQRAR